MSMESNDTIVCLYQVELARVCVCVCVCACVNIYMCMCELATVLVPKVQKLQGPVLC